LQIGLGVVVLFVTFVGALSGVRYFVNRDTRDDLTKMQGEWKFTRAGTDADSGPSTGVRIAGDRWTYVVGGTGRETPHRLVLNPAANPKEIDLIRIRDDGSPEVFARARKPVELRQVGVYELDGDTLRVALAPANEPRPKAMDDTPTLTFTRVKK
jgi:uncharacterized protein (TIGR03067 family)